MCCAVRENSLGKGQFKRPDISSTTADTSGLISPELVRLRAIIVFRVAVPEASLNQLSVISYQLSVLTVYGVVVLTPTHKGALGGGRATTRI